MKVKKILNVGIIGLGIGLKHYNCFEKNPYTKVIAICDKSSKKLNKINKKIDKYKNAIDLISNKDIDIVSICSFDNNHYEHILQCVEYKKNIFCEKPICLTYNEFKKLSFLLPRQKKFFGINFNLRTTPSFKNLKKKISQNNLGKIFSIEGGYESGRLYKITKGWRGKIKNYSLSTGGLIHLVDLVFWLINHNEKKNQKLEIFSQGNSIASEKFKLGIEDNIVTILKFEKITIFLKASLGCVVPHFHSLKIYGTKRTYVNDFNYRGYFEKSKRIKFKKDRFEYPGNLKHETINQFIEMIRKNKKKENIHNLRDILKISKISLAIQKSLKSSKSITINV